MTGKERDCFAYGFIAGGIAMLLITALIFWSISRQDPTQNYHPNELLNSSEWTIDTITTQSSNGTSVEYKFIQKEN